MPSSEPLHRLLDEPVRARGEHLAVADGGGDGQLTYAALGALSDRLRDRLAAGGVGRGDRVGIYLRKSCDSVAAIYGILKAGAAYVPVDPTAPASRNAYIHGNCQVKVAVVERRFEAQYREELDKLGQAPQLIVIDDVGGGKYLAQALDRLDAASASPAVPTVDSAAEDLAYILYTSGSTGKPKGVMLTHGNAVSFVRWCEQAFEPLSSDVFSSHAPFHFDLSILDLYVPLTRGASLVLVPEETGKEPKALADLIAARRISVWYSAPSTLSLLAQFGDIAAHDFSRLRIVLFAGEVFPIVHLRSLRQQLPSPAYFNLYGPTETNVCTYFELPAAIEAERTEPYPIGKTCSNLEGRVVTPDGQDVEAGQEGELCIAGPNVMVGYWGLPELTAGSFLSSSDGKRWYKTGDIVNELADGNFRYVGRRDRMVKRRGYRVELGEIEVCLYRHPDLREAAVVAVLDAEGGVRIKAHLSMRDEKKLSIIALKTFCSQHLPVYMVPDAFVAHAALPKTSTDKIDYQALKALG